MRLASLHVYPVKSCRGISVETATIVERGFEGDRRWMIVDRSGRFVTQRELPELALVRTRFAASTIVLEADGAEPMRLLEDELDETPVEVEVWQHRGLARVHRAGSAWISARLGAEYSVVHMPDSHRRGVNPRYAREGDIVSFADAYPFLLATSESLDDLNRRSPSPVPMNRFRPNLVTSGSPAWAEDGWTRVWIGEVPFRVAKPCERCSTTTVDQDTGVRGKEPLRTLATFRDQGNGVLFGVNLIHEAIGTLRVGDAVRVE